MVKPFPVKVLKVVALIDLILGPILWLFLVVQDSFKNDGGILTLGVLAAWIVGLCLYALAQLVAQNAVIISLLKESTVSPRKEAVATSPDPALPESVTTPAQ